VGFAKAAAPFWQALTLVSRQGFGSGQRCCLACIGGEDETTLGVEPCLPGRERGGQGPRDPIRHFFWHSVWCWPSTVTVGGCRAHPGPFEPRGLHVLVEGLQGLWRIGSARQGGAAEFFAGLQLGCTGRMHRLLSRALHPRLAGLRIDHAPALRHVCICRSPLLVAITICQRGHRARRDRRQHLPGLLQGGRDPREPLQPTGSQGAEVLGTVPRASGDERRHLARGMEWLDMLREHVATGDAGMGVAAAGLHKHRKARVGGDDQRQPPLVQVWPVIATGALGHRNDLGLRLRGTVLPPIAVEARRIQGHHLSRQAEAPRGLRSAQTLERRDAVLIEGIKRAPPHVIMKRLGLHPWSPKPLQGVGVKKAGHQGQWLMHKPQAMKPHRLNGLSQGHGALGAILHDGLINHLVVYLQPAAISEACKSGRIPLFHHPWEGVLPWSPISFSTS
jgi:hypothetical protein